MKRREVLSLLGSVALTGPAIAQTAGRIYRVTVLAQSPSHAGFRSIVVPELARRGFVEGRNLEIAYRAGPISELPALADALVKEGPDAAFAVATPPALALLHRTTTIPIVLFGGEDAISEGLAETLSQPGGNVTGVVILSNSLNPKRMELLHEAIPEARRIGVLLFSGSPVVGHLERDVQTAATKAGLDVIVALSAGRVDYDRAFRTFKEAGAQGLVIGAAAQFFADADLLVSMARAAALPTACEWAEMARIGCLLGYGPRREPLYQTAGRKLAEVLQGTPPSRLPIERPALFDLGVNLKTAVALGLTISPSIIARADDVIE